MKKPTKADISLLSRALAVARGMVNPKSATEDAKPKKKMMNGGKAMKKKKEGGVVKFSNGDLIDVSRGQAGYDFKGIF